MSRAPRETGIRILCRGNPGWGVGHVLADDGRARVTVFFQAGILHRRRCPLLAWMRTSDLDRHFHPGPEPVEDRHESIDREAPKLRMADAREVSRRRLERNRMDVLPDGKLGRFPAPPYAPSRHFPQSHVDMSRIMMDTSAYSVPPPDRAEVKAAIQRASAIGLSVVSIGELRAGLLTGDRRRLLMRVMCHGDFRAPAEGE